GCAVVAEGIIKSTDALLSTTFNHDQKTLYCQINFATIIGTPSWKEFTQLLAQKWEFIPNVKSYLSEVLSDQIKQFEKVRVKYDPDKIFFDNKSLQDIFSRALGS
ncbi:6672_t:CDS:2, partial [Ambispora leptoticha]